MTGELVGARYRLHSELGRGGMAVAYAATDTSTGETVALKRLLPKGVKGAAMARLFEREYHTLKQLSHPRVVRVYDFGQDAEGNAYYTMEWLGGGDLAGLSPLPYAQVCALLSDVASALSLLHSRRLVHRDVTARNIRCDETGHAKLIDFGAVTPFGPAPRVVGTPQFCPPEAVTGQELDGRADLYALGAAAYQALTGRHAYPARNFGMLRDLWSSRPRPPSHYQPDIPRALDDLVLALLALDRMARPTSAAEVMERLCAIGGIDMAEQLVVQQAYLTSPRLVGRDVQMKQLRNMLTRALRTPGGAALVRGEAGMGRSRFAVHCVLEAKLLGATVARADAGDGAIPFGAARELAKQVAQALPDLARELPTSQQELLFDPGDADGGEMPAPLASALQTALRSFMLRAASRKPLVLVLDDAHRVDERSAALFGLLADMVQDHRLVLIATAETGETDSGPLAFFEAAAMVVKMRPLSLEDTHQLFRSVFGDVQHLSILTARLHDIGAGSPGSMMSLAQHLLERGTVRYEAGAFVLPARLDPGDLPASLQAALLSRLRRLSTTALLLAQGMSLAQRSLPLDDLVVLMDAPSARDTWLALDELVAMDVVKATGLQYSLARPSYGAVLQAELDEDDRKALHLRIAELYRQREPRSWLRVRHLLLAGCLDEAVDLAVTPPEKPVTAADVARESRELPDDWQEHLRALIAHAHKTGRSKLDQHTLLSKLASHAAMRAEAKREDVEILLRNLEHACGRDIYDSLDERLPKAERIRQSFAQAQARYDATPECERLFPPKRALSELARAVVRAIGVMGPRYDYAFFEGLTSIEPFASLSAALQVTQWNVEGTRGLAAGRSHILLERNARILERMAQQDRAGLDSVAHRYVGLAIRYSSALTCATYGRPIDPEHLADMDRDPVFAINACHLRMLAALAVGDIEQADRHRRQAELLRLQDNPPQMFEGSYMTREAMVFAFAGDLARLKQVLPGIARRAARTPGWRPVQHYADGMYQRLRGCPKEALSEFEAGLSPIRAGRHGFFPNLAEAQVLTLCQLDRREEACMAGEAHLAAAEAADMGPATHRQLEALAQACAEVGQHDRAKELAERAVAVLEDFEAGGLALGSAHETSARVAVLRGDHKAFAQHARRCAHIYRSGHNALLTARYARLMTAAEARRLAVSEELASAAADSIARTVDELSITQCADPAERARIALKTLLSSIGASDGYLYTVQAEGPSLTAQVGAPPPPLEMDQRVARYLNAELEESEDRTMTCAAPTAEGPNVDLGEWRGADGGQYLPILLNHGSERGLELTGLALIRTDARRNLPAPALIAAISLALHQSGDVATMLAG